MCKPGYSVGAPHVSCMIHFFRLKRRNQFFNPVPSLYCGFGPSLVVALHCAIVATITDSLS